MLKHTCGVGSSTQNVGRVLVLNNPPAMMSSICFCSAASGFSESHENASCSLGFSASAFFLASFSSASFFFLSSSSAAASFSLVFLRASSSSDRCFSSASLSAFSLSQQGHSEHALDRDRSMTYLRGICSHRRADSVGRFNVGRVLVVNNPPASSSSVGGANGWPTDRNSSATMRSSTRVYRLGNSAREYSATPRSTMGMSMLG